MFEKLVVDTSRLIKQDGETVGLKVVQKIKNDFVRSPITDKFIANPKIKTPKQLMAKLEKQLSAWEDKDDILKNVNENNIDVVMKMAETKVRDKYFVFEGYLKKITPLINSQNKADIMNDVIRIAETKEINLQGYKAFNLLEKLETQKELQYKINDVSDPKILELFKTNNIHPIDNDLSKFFELDSALDVYHTFNKNYSCVEGNKAEYYNYIKNHSSLSENPPAIQEAIVKDFANEARIEKMKEFCKKNPDSELSNHFYNEYYLKSEIVPKEIRAKCAEINEKFGTKVFLSNEHSNDDISLNYIKEELSDWQKASGGEAKIPTVLDFSKIKREYIDEGSAYGQGSAGGFQERFNNSISIDGLSVEKIKYAIRHEMTHLNDLKKGKNIPEKYNLEEIMPKKKIKIKDAQLNEKEISVPDFENCKYKEEFYNAGIAREHVLYAYNNTKEFIAVASEGRMSQYSSGFKQMLVDFGMPEWMFKMKHSDKIEVDAIFDTMLKQEK